MGAMAFLIYFGGFIQSRRLGRDWTGSIFWPATLGMAMVSWSSKHKI